MIETLEAVGVAATAIDLVADKFMDAATVSWGDLHTAGVTGRDIVRARRHLAGPPVAAPPAAGTATSPDSVVAASVEGAVSSAPSAIAVVWNQHQQASSSRRQVLCLSLARRP